MKFSIKSALIIFCSYVLTVHGVSIVYNIRVAEITRRQALSPQYTNPSIVVATVFDQRRTRFDQAKDNIEAA